MTFCKIIAMKTTPAIKLDWKKLLGFNLAVEQRKNGLTPANLAKIGAKAGLKAAGIKGS